MPRIVRRRIYDVPSLPGDSLTVDNWLALLDRTELAKVHAWAEPWPLLQTMSDREALDYVERYRMGGIAGLIAGQLSFC